MKMAKPIAERSYPRLQAPPQPIPSSELCCAQGKYRLGYASGAKGEIADLFKKTISQKAR